MVSLLPPARWPVVPYLPVVIPAVVIPALAILALVVIGALLGGQVVEDVGSWRWSSWRPV